MEEREVLLHANDMSQEGRKNGLGKDIHSHNRLAAAATVTKHFNQSLSNQ